MKFKTPASLFNGEPHNVTLRFMFSNDLRKVGTSIKLQLSVITCINLGIVAGLFWNTLFLNLKRINHALLDFFYFRSHGRFFYRFKCKNKCDFFLLIHLYSFSKHHGLQIIDHLFKSNLTFCVVCVFSVQTDEWCVHNRLFNVNFEDKFK
jgi:hypothetical protein